MSRALITAISKASCDRFAGSGASQAVSLSDPVMFTAQSAPISSASASASLVACRFRSRVASSDSIRLFQTPTSAITTSCIAKAVLIARTRSVSSNRTGGQ